MEIDVDVSLVWKGEHERKCPGRSQWVDVRVEAVLGRNEA
jgi:hypothetical protein